MSGWTPPEGTPIEEHDGARLQHSVEAGPGDLLYVLPDYPHQSLNPSDTEPVDLVVARTTADGHAGNVVVEIEAKE